MTDSLDRQADKAAEFYGFTEGERVEYMALRRHIADNPSAMKKFIRRQRKFMAAVGMSPTIKSRPEARSKRSK